MNIELDERLIGLLDRFDKALVKPYRGEDVSRIASMIAIRVGSKYQVKRLFQNVAKGTIHEDLEVLK